MQSKIDILNTKIKISNSDIKSVIPYAPEIYFEWNGRIK